MNTGRTAFWINEIGRPLEALLKRSAYSESLRHEYISFFTAHLVPLLGPCPSEFTISKPTTFLSDDHTPCEIIWAIRKGGEMSVRFALEPISSTDGASYSPSLSMRAADNLAHFLKDCDLTWSTICGDDLVSDATKESPNTLELKHFSQFMFGGEFKEDGILGKMYFFPNVRSAVTGKSVESIVGECLSRLGVSVGYAWETLIIPYFASIFEEFRPIPDMISVDCLSPAHNRVKVYFRSQLSSFNAISDMLTLGGRLSDESTMQTVSTLRHLWELFFPGVAHNASLISTRRGSYYPSGFLLYYEMIPGRRFPIPKVYIPVRHYCRDDAQIATAISQYFKDQNMDDIADRYTSDLEGFFPHRPLSARTGIHAYVAICTKEDGPQIFIYMCPEAFAAERHLFQA